MNNVSTPSEIIAQKSQLGELIINADIWNIILDQSHDASN
jgi:hypothetical protein